MSKFSLDQFLEACGADGPLHLKVDRGEATDEFVLPQPFALAGSDPRADVRVADSRLPRRTAFFQVLGGRVLGLDLTADGAGRHGTYPPHHWLSPGEAWPCGGLNFRLAGDRSGIPGAEQALRRENLPTAALEITGGSRGVCQYSLKAPIALIGKSAHCQVRLRDAAVSRFHCALIHTPAGLWAVDLLGRAGITVNGRKARAARLDDGDELRVGGFSLRSRAALPSAGADRAGGEALAGLPLPSLPAMLDRLPAMSGALDGGASADLGPVVSLLVALQQQMAEQHRLTMTSVVDCFRRMHDDQMKMIWGELAEIRRLTEEVTTLKTTMAQLPAAGIPSAPVSLTVRPIQNDAPAATSTRPPTERPTPVQRTSAPNRTPGAGSTKAAPIRGDVHAWLSQRVADVQKEREGKWQKIVSFLTGAPP